MRSSPTSFLPLVVFLAACSSSSSGGTAAPAPSPAVGRYALHYTTSPAAETHWCEYKKMPKTASGEVLVRGVTWSWQNAHHWSLYRLQPGAPANLPLDQPFDCFAPVGAMQYAQSSSAFVQAEPKGADAFPEGTAFPFRSEEVVIFQTHSVNTTAAPLDVTLDVDFQTVDASTEPARLGLIQFYDPYIVVPAHTEATAQMRCRVPQDITLVRSTTHTHTRGLRVDSYLDQPDGTPAATPFVSSTNWDTPPVLNDAVKVPSGAYLRTVCKYKGDEHDLVVQGQYKGDKEMCMLIAYYHPVVEGPTQAIFENCVQTPLPIDVPVSGVGDSYGSGANACGAALGCIQKVDPSEFPNPHDGQIDVGPAFQKCIVDSCASASVPLFTLLKCVQSSCEKECRDPSTCPGCVVAKCGSEYAGCSKHACDAAP